MHWKTPKHLRDLLAAAREITALAGNKPAQQLAAERLVRLAVERQFITIGEAITRIRKDDSASAVALGDTREIVKFRNILVHNYDAIDPTIVWQIVQSDLPRLISSAEALLSGGSGTHP